MRLYASALKRLEDTGAKEDGRCFSMKCGDLEVGFFVARRDLGPVFSGALPEDEPLSDEDCLRALAFLLKRCEMPEIDVEEVWESYRRQILETVASKMPLPVWRDLPGEVRDAFGGAVLEGVRGGMV